MSNLTDNAVHQVRAIGVRFEGNLLHVTLSDRREIALPLDKIKWLTWLNKASPEQRNRWKIEPGGYAIHWEDLDDGIEVCHLLDRKPLV